MKMELWAEAQKSLNNADSNTDIELTLVLLNNNTSIPLILTNANDSIIDGRNIDSLLLNDPKKSAALIQSFKAENRPIKIEYDENKYNNLYYGNSPLISKLKYYPIALLLIILLFALLIFNFYKTSKIATQNKLWAGMAKETAHQIGTPLSSLIGWLEIMKANNYDETIIAEIEKDILRLQTITDRFSKVGSEPVLEQKDIIAETKNSFDYLQSRFSKQVEFSFSAPDKEIMVLLNPALHSWTIENLIKNSVDAMKGKGVLDVNIIEIEKEVNIYISDSGKGIPKNQFKKIFEPGYTTKKRGWGLGLSLTKRIVEEYHKGKIRVQHSDIGKGTTMLVSFKKT
ncbi:two-component sensor histidine kinase [Flavobacterium orientale]|uniref:histidine kinase n=2 Tax=Flavobacterium orientale TaxID=1756020 RepID=A0A916XX40_9FLAO|nr:two-component sensor histidine kinase [Flavobacterium orientale]